MTAGRMEEDPKSDWEDKQNFDGRNIGTQFL